MRTSGIAARAAVASVVHHDRLHSRARPLLRAADCRDPRRHAGQAHAREIPGRRRHAAQSVRAAHRAQSRPAPEPRVAPRDARPHAKPAAGRGVGKTPRAHRPDVSRRPPVHRRADGAVAMRAAGPRPPRDPRRHRGGAGHVRRRARPHQTVPDPGGSPVAARPRRDQPARPAARGNGAQVSPDPEIRRARPPPAHGGRNRRTTGEAAAHRRYGLRQGLPHVLRRGAAGRPRGSRRHRAAAGPRRGVQRAREKARAGRAAFRGGQQSPTRRRKRSTC